MNWHQMRYQAIKDAYARGEISYREFVFFTDPDACIFIDDELVAANSTDA